MSIDGLKREQVLALKPGRELDATVAEKVMGWFLDSDIGYWRNESGLCKRQDKWSPSEDIAAAFEAETKVIEKDPSMYVHALASVVFGYSQVQDISDIRKMCTLIHATPEQRCKAALLAVMDGEDKHGD